MNSFTRRLTLDLKALRDLGLKQSGLYAWYRLALKAGFFQWAEARQMKSLLATPTGKVASPLLLPSRAEIASTLDHDEDNLIAEANELLQGQVRLFGGPPVPLQLAVPGRRSHWTAYEGKALTGDGKDVKFTWEPGRFGWVFPLGRAYHLTDDERYASCFWRNFESFTQANPPFLGLHWVSAQEVALRLIALAFASQVFAHSPQSTPERLDQLSVAMATHAIRIPPTLAYARAQNNNHLLSEAAGLITAGTFLPEHPKAADWRRLGWRWFNTAIQQQIAEDGAYTQHSCNYQRLVLQAALWVNTLGEPFPQETIRRLAAATGWLLALVDPYSGRVPNLGPNDGAYLLPLAACEHCDYRPVLQAASLAFLGRPAFESGPWDELALWLGYRNREGNAGKRSAIVSPAPRDSLAAPHVLRREKQGAWAYLRAVRFDSRPGHADQLHLDLWWQGLNVAQDAGTYLYNGPPPWDNALAGSGVHNTLTIDGQDQMTRAGRFLWVDWAQARLVSRERAPDGSSERLVAEQDGYRHLGLNHRRTVTVQDDGRWRVEDYLHHFEGPRQGEPVARPRLFRLHWLLPDWPWEIETQDGFFGVEIHLGSPLGQIRLRTGVNQGDPLSAGHTLARAGELLSGEGPVSLTWGWASPTYGVKVPALSFARQVTALPPVALFSEWVLP